MKKAKILSFVAGGLCFLAVALLIFLCVYMWEGIIPAMGAEAEDYEGLGVVVIAFIWIIITIALVPCMLSDLIFGILHFALKKKRKLSIASAILGGLDLVAALGVLLIAGMASAPFRWLFVLEVPIIASFVVRIVCAVICSKAEKANATTQPTQE